MVYTEESPDVEKGVQSPDVEKGVQSPDVEKGEESPDVEKGEDGPSEDGRDEKKHQKIDGKTMYAVVSILTVEMCERLTFYSITANIMLYCTSVLQMTDPEAVKTNQIFSGSAMILPLIGGYIADAYSGRYNAIIGASLIYTVGLVLIPASAFDYRPLFVTELDGSSFDLSVETRQVFYFIGLACIALGTGGIKSTVGPFGAQQLEGYGKAAVRSYFNWFYWFINIGSTIAFTGVAYVQQNISFTWGYLVPLITMVLVLIFFVFSKNAYIMLPPGDSAVKITLGVLSEAVRKKGHGHTFFNSPRKRFGGSYDDSVVSGVISLLKALLLFLPVLGYSVCYFQASSLTYIQSLRMKVRINDFLIPVAALGIFNTIIILVVIPFFDRVLYPYLEKIGKPLTHIRRMGVGMVSATLGIAIGGVVEIFRKRELVSSGGIVQQLGGKDYLSSKYTVFLQVPQIVLNGISEVFVLVPALEFSFTQVPFNMQGLMQGTVLALFGVGSYLGAAILDAINAATSDDPWLSNDMNNSHAENIFFLLAGLLVLTIIIYVTYVKIAKPGDIKPSGPSKNDVPLDSVTEKK